MHYARHSVITYKLYKHGWGGGEEWKQFNRNILMQFMNKSDSPGTVVNIPTS
jgi:hypothetical protein